MVLTAPGRGDYNGCNDKDGELSLIHISHQIRVQTAQIGHPVCGDPLYGPKHQEKGLQGQCLHARTIGFLHPESGRYLEFTSDLPPYFTAFLQALTTRYGGIYE